MTDLDHLAHQFGTIVFGSPEDHSRMRLGGYDAAPDQAFFHRGAHEIVQLSPHEPLTSGQATYQPQKVHAIATARGPNFDQTKQGHWDLPRVYEHEDGERVVVDGHHRITGDRLAGRSTYVKLIKPEHLGGRRRWGP